MKQLILGGARSGKSAIAERLATESDSQVLYIATATSGDGEMAERIAKHRQRRPDHWLLTEEPVHLAATLKQQAREGLCILVDCLTLWLTNIMFMDEGRHFQVEMDALLKTLPELPGEIIMVSNEVGLGIVPMGEMTRQFQDESGLLHQNVAAVCDRVVLTVAGLPHTLKGEKL
ncbi:bifunctional adenosylcobinamide kinase/adenosylcobinamide-phosphate guanylyltransferase [Amphritea balenae]|uniref:Bifunctional adenosylcobalamin biosynthesis protein n=1 Tax=Amphritea balenae TaxID=452629 RepID=A0A3P1SJA0_9GAMM|nr:bifunctional adenosylcobinamide kinase/adenosylcobinamide-phosphate guanylyltransferase [Amphritea balenae]RRC97104.1 bifunctional adenosylcobinamide kinase/adenosylcobinamide-phosphate guanylyltransferase [Amphritea balenae]GGK68048.1 adenosylcobinamide kinase/adenosylcobinamide phosphate guanyltransferase [Amphritea balenae]